HRVSIPVLNETVVARSFKIHLRSREECDKFLDYPLVFDRRATRNSCPKRVDPALDIAKSCLRIQTRKQLNIIVEDRWVFIGKSVHCQILGQGEFRVRKEVVEAINRHAESTTCMPVEIVEVLRARNSR